MEKFSVFDKQSGYLHRARKGLRIFSRTAFFYRGLFFSAFWICIPFCLTQDAPSSSIAKTSLTQAEALLAQADRLIKGGDLKSAFTIIHSVHLLAEGFEREFPQDQELMEARIVALSRGMAVLGTLGNDREAAEWRTGLTDYAAQFRAQLGEDAFIALEQRGAFH